MHVSQNIICNLKSSIEIIFLINILELLMTFNSIDTKMTKSEEYDHVLTHQIFSISEQLDLNFLSHIKLLGGF